MSAHISPASFFFFNDTATTEIYTLSLHDALPISVDEDLNQLEKDIRQLKVEYDQYFGGGKRSEEHTSELQSRSDLVCRLLLEKKKSSRSPVSSYLLHTRLDHLPHLALLLIRGSLP